MKDDPQLRPWIVAAARVRARVLETVHLRRELELLVRGRGGGALGRDLRAATVAKRQPEGASKSHSGALLEGTDASECAGRLGARGGQGTHKREHIIWFGAWVCATVPVSANLRSSSGSSKKVRLVIRSDVDHIASPPPSGN